MVDRMLTVRGGGGCTSIIAGSHVLQCRIAGNQGTPLSLPGYPTIPPQRLVRLCGLTGFRAKKELTARSGSDTPNAPEAHPE